MYVMIDIDKNSVAARDFYKEGMELLKGEGSFSDNLPGESIKCI